MSWISKNLTLDLLAIAIGGMQNAFDRIKSEPESDWPPAEVPTAAQPAVESAPASQPAQPQAQEPDAQPEPTPAPEPAAAPPATVDRLPEAQAHLRDISLAGGMEWITGELFPAFGTESLTDIPDEQLPQLIDKAAAYKLEKGLG